MINDLTKKLRGLGMAVIEPAENDFDPENGKLLMWEAPQPGEVYALGVDPAEGVSGDNSVCEVIKIGTINHPDVQVAEFASNYLDPVEFAEVVNHIGRFYCGPDGQEAFLTLECNAACGDTMINDLFRRLDYTNVFIWKVYDRVNGAYTNRLGWWTNRTTRPKLIARGLHAFIYGDLIVNSEHLLNEMTDFQRDPLLAKDNALRSGKHDDRIMALLMGYWGAHDEEWLRGEDIATERRLAQTVKEVQEEQIAVMDPTQPRRDYQNQCISTKKMWEMANESMNSDW